MKKPRQNININRDWRFRYFSDDNLAQDNARADFDDRLWKPVALPHTWSTFETTGEMHPFIRDASESDDQFWWYGWGWYRKTFDISSIYDKKRVFLEFDGVQKYCRLWVNGEYIGEHKGGYTSFSFEITRSLRFDSGNVIAMAVSNRRDDVFGGIPPMTAGNFNVYGGIYRDVRLVIKNPVYIPFQGSAEHEGGTFVTTPEVSARQANVRVKTYVKNTLDSPQNCEVVNKIISPGGRLIGEMSGKSLVPSGRIDEFDQISHFIDNPELWSPENPVLYRVETCLKVDGELRDQCVSPLGFRWFQWDYESKCLYWNGVKQHIHGTNRHQEYPWLGDALPKWIHEMDMVDIKYNLGHNFIRTCHYPQDKYIYEFCDKHGMIVCEEVPNIKPIDFSDEVQKQNLVEMIRRDRNHPCIAMWSLGNETQDAADEQWALEEDTTRIVHCRKAKGRGGDVAHTHKQIDMEHLLRCTVRGWYNKDVKNHEPENGQHTGHETWQHDRAMLEDGSIRGRLDRQGVMWIYADHGADRKYVNCPLNYINPKGWVDAYRIPKYLYYLWQANWCEKPVIYIHPFDWTERYLGEKREIVVNSNCEWVELYVDGVCQGRQTPDKSNFHTVRFQDITVKKGEITAIGKRDGRIAKHSHDMPGKAAAVKLSSHQKEITADRAGIALIKVDIVDEKGDHVYGASNELNFSLDGPGVLTSPARFSSDKDKCEDTEGTMYIDAPVQLPLRSTASTGKIELTVTSPGLEPDSITVYCAAPEEMGISGLSFHELEDGPECSPVAAIKDVSSGDRNEIQGALAQTQTDIDWGDMPLEDYREKLDQRIKTENPNVEPDRAAYEELLNVLCKHLDESDGVLIRDDYNFIVNRYNQRIENADAEK